MKKYLYIVFMMISVAAHATSESYDLWDGHTATTIVPSGHVYTVSTVAELAFLAQQNDLHNGYTGDTIRIAAHLDLNGYEWMPLGSKSRPFSGVLDGQNHLVRGLTRFTGTDGIGLLGHIGSNGQVLRLGISGGQVEANNQRRIGCLAGVNRGLIANCWNMAEIHLAGSAVGGLVGENRGTLRDVYNAGIILLAADTIGGLVGINRGSIEYAYVSGYAHNGYALVGCDQIGSSYTECYHDRKLYYQSTGSLSSGITSVDQSGQMCSLFLTRPTWFHATNLYPTLSGFETTDAARLSAVTLWLDTNSVSPPDHANDLMMNMQLGTQNGVIWSCREEQGTQWIQISGANATVYQTCDGADVLLNADLGSEQRIVYTHPRRLNDFNPGFFGKKEGAYDAWCPPSNFPLSMFTDLRPASEGWKYGAYHYQVVLDSINPMTGDTTRLQVLLPDTDLSGLMTWFNSYTHSANTHGYYAIRIYAHDEQCATEWIPMRGGGYVFEVYAYFDSGRIINGEDTVYGASATVNAYNLIEATGGGGTIGYTWYVTHDGTQEVIPGQNDKDLVNYVVTGVGIYVFSRGAYDDFCETVPSSSLDHGTFVLVLRDSLDPGELLDTARIYCSPADALRDTLFGTEPTGGTGYYDYQWYINGTPIAGATRAYLALADVTGLTGGETYTFTREVTDHTDHAIHSLSRHRITAIIYTGFDAGRIQNRTLSDRCIFGSTIQNITVRVTSEVDASGDGTLVYTWFRAEADGSNPVVIGHDASLDLTFPSSDIETGKTYIYYREVTNTACGSNPKRSNGLVTQTYLANDHTDSTLTVCASSLPYTVYYPDPADGPYTHTFTADEVGVPYTFRDMSSTSDCYPTMTLTIDTFAAVEIRIDSLVSLCQEAGNINLYYDVVQGCPDSFYIQLSPDLAPFFDNQDHLSGIMEGTCAGETGCIKLTDVRRIPKGNHYLYLQVGYRRSTGSEICLSRSHYVALDVQIGGYIYSKFDKVLFVDNAPDNDERLTFTAYQWYKNGVLQVGQTGQYYQENGNTLTGTYYADLTTVENGKTITYRSCDVIMPQGTSASVAPVEQQDAYLTIYHDRVVIVRGKEMFDLIGRKVL